MAMNQSFLLGQNCQFPLDNAADNPSEHDDGNSLIYHRWFAESYFPRNECLWLSGCQTIHFHLGYPSGAYLTRPFSCSTQRRTYIIAYT